MLKAFFFDVDGTLADTERHGHRVAFNQAFKQFGLNWYWSDKTCGDLLDITGGKESIDWFEVIGAGDIVPNKKPASDIYHFVLQHLGLSAGDCVAFEDSYKGLEASKGAGLKTIITRNGYTVQDDFNGAELVTDHLGVPDYPSRVM